MFGHGSPFSFPQYNSTLHAAWISRQVVFVWRSALIAWSCMALLHAGVGNLIAQLQPLSSNRQTIAAQKTNEAVGSSDNQVRLRFSWGGGESKQWTGLISVVSNQTDPNQTDPNQTDPNQTDPNQTDPNQTDPNQTDPSQSNSSLNSAKEVVFAKLQPLGLTLDATGSVVLANDMLHIHHWSPTNFGGADLSIYLPPDAKLKIELSPLENPTQRFAQTISIAELLDGRFQQPLDETGNRFVIERAPGDQLPVRLNREHLVFSPGEVFNLSLRANRTVLTSQTANCKLNLAAHALATNSPSLMTLPTALPTSLTRGTQSLWKETISFELDATGSTREQTVSVTVPSAEGIYDLSIELSSNWQTAGLNSRNEVSRSIQLVVLEKNALHRHSEPTPTTGLKISDQEQSWKRIGRIDPTETLAAPTELRDPKLDPFSVSNLSRFSLTNKASSLGNELRRVVNIDNRSMLELSPGGWTAIPIPTARLEHPHLIEVEYLADQPMSIGMSLLQPDASGQVPLYGFDSGVTIPSSLIELQPANGKRLRQTHRIVCWPHHKQPYLLIANRDAQRVATIGRIKVSAGPDRLPVTKQPTHGPQPNRNMRGFMAFFESPLFAESFGAHESVDPVLGQPLDDWEMFYQGADRFIQHLKSNHYSGAFVSVASDGSAIYPSQLLGPSPKHDTGIFFSNGQDPIRKDVLELLFRMFEREGLTLVPTLALSGPLPMIETQRLQNLEPSHQSNPTKNVSGIDGADLVHYTQSRTARTIDSQLPIYNPLDTSVQQSVSSIVSELAQRYSHFESFRGLAVVCRPDTYTLLPGQQWGFDSNTMSRFWNSQSNSSPAPTSMSDWQLALLKTRGNEWTNWRAEQMSAAYQQWLAQLQQHIPNAELYLAPVDLYRLEELSSALAPSLHTSTDFQGQMLNVGLQSSVFAHTPGLHLLKPQRVSPNDGLAANRVELGLEQHRAADDFFSNANSIGELYSHRISWAHFAQFEQQSPFGKQTAPIMRTQPLSPGGSWNRQRFVNSLRVSDTRLLIDGGPILTTGEEAELQDFIDTFVQLPNQPFANVELSRAITKPSSAILPVVVRQRNQQNQTWFYAVNASPWPTRVTLNCSAGRSISIESLSHIVMQTSTTTNGNQIQFDLPPLGFAAGIVNGIAINNYQFQLPDNASERLRKQVYALQAKLAKAANVQPLPVLQNPDFESYGQPTLVGWDFGQQSANNIQLNSKSGHQGHVSVQLRNTDGTPAWIRSNPIPSPTTGRLSISVWLRTDSPNPQPALRLAIEGTVGNTSYYRFGSVGALSPNPTTNQIGQQWQRFAVHFDDLPIERLSNLRIGFDLMQPGEVHLDHVEVFDRWFDEQDTRAITQRLAGCGPLLVNPSTLESCRLLLDSYWLRFLDERFDNPIDSTLIEQPAIVQPLRTPAQEVEIEAESSGRTPRRFRRLGGGRNSNLK